MKHTHIVRCVTSDDPYLTNGKEYTCWLDAKESDYGRVDAAGITCDDGVDNYFMFPDEYIIVGEIENA